MKRLPTIAVAVACVLCLSSRPVFADSFPLPPAPTYVVTTTQVGALQVTFSREAHYDWPMQAPQATLRITNTSGSRVWNKPIALSISTGPTGGLAAYPASLFLEPGESQTSVATLDQGLNQLPSGPSSSTVTITWTFQDQGTIQTPLDISNWTPLLTGSGRIPAQSAMTLAGRVVDEQGNAVNAAVAIGLGTYLGDRISRSGNAANGEFSFSVPRATSWVISATKSGYQSAFYFLRDTTDRSDIRLVMHPKALRFTFASAVTKEVGNALWQGTVSADDRLVFLNPAIESWPPSMLPFETSQKAFLYTTSGEKVWEKLVGWDAKGGDLSADGRWAVYSRNQTTAGQSGPAESALIVLLDAADGRTVWSRRIPDLPGEGGQLRAAQEVRFSPDGTILLVGENFGELTALSRTDGTVLWSMFLKGEIRSIRMSDDRRTAYVTSGARVTVRIALADGAVLWSAPSGSWAHQTGLKESADGTMVGVISQEGIVTMLDARSGSVLWTLALGARGHWAGFSADSSVFVCSTLNGTYGFVPQTGDRLFVVQGSSGGSFARGQNFFMLPAGASTVGVYDTTGTMISNPIQGLDWSDPNYYFGWMAADGSRAVFAKNFVTSTSGPVLFFASGTATAGNAAPSGLTATSSGSSVTLMWSAPSSGATPTAYSIEAGSSTGLVDLASFSTGSTATTFSASGVAPGAYYVRVRAISSTGTSAPSNEAVLTVGGGACSSAPTAPSSLQASINGGTVTLLWNPSTGLPTSYVVEAGSSVGLTDLANTDTGGTATTLTATGVGVGNYFVRVRGKNACGASAPSNEVVVTVR